MPQSPYQSTGQGMSHLGQVMQQLAVGLAQQKYQQQQAAQQYEMQRRQMAMQEAQARQRSDLYGAQTGLAQARTGAITNQQQATGQLGDASWLMGMLNAEKNMGGPVELQDQSLPLREDMARARAMSAMSQLPDAQRSKVPQNIAQMMQMGDRRFQQMLGTETKMNANVGPGAMLFDMLNQRQVASSPRTLNPEQILVPNEVGSQGLDKTFAPGSDNNLMGTLAGIVNSSKYMGTSISGNDPLVMQAQQVLQQFLNSKLAQGTNTQGTGRAGIQAPQAQIQVPQPRLVSPTDKASLANQLSQQNPTWTREQVLQAVQQQLGE